MVIANAFQAGPILWCKTILNGVVMTLNGVYKTPRWWYFTPSLEGFWQVIQTLLGKNFTQEGIKCNLQGINRTLNGIEITPDWIKYTLWCRVYIDTLRCLIAVHAE